MQARVKNDLGDKATGKTDKNYALANSNAMDGMSTSTHIEKLNTWYDNLITGLRIGFGVLTVLCAAMYLLGLKKKEQ